MYTTIHDKGVHKELGADILRKCSPPLRLTCHMSGVPCHMSPVACHVWHDIITPELLRQCNVHHSLSVTCHMSLVIFLFLWINWWSQSVEGLLSVGPILSSLRRFIRKVSPNFFFPIKKKYPWPPLKRIYPPPYEKKSGHPQKEKKIYNKIMVSVLLSIQCLPYEGFLYNSRKYTSLKLRCHFGCNCGVWF